MFWRWFDAEGLEHTVVAQSKGMAAIRRRSRREGTAGRQAVENATVERMHEKHSVTRRANQERTRPRYGRRRAARRQFAAPNGRAIAWVQSPKSGQARRADEHAGFDRLGWRNPLTSGTLP